VSAQEANAATSPGTMPRGEEILWRGRPRMGSLAVHAFHVRKVAIYFAALIAWRGVSTLWDGEGVAEAAIAAGLTTLPALASIAVLTGLAWLFSWTTHYTITSQRIVMQFGVALPVTLNIPFRIVANADVKLYADGTGEMPIAISGTDRVSYVLLWPHARPWRIARAEPMLRAVPDGQRVAGILARALAAASPFLQSSSASEVASPADSPRPIAAAAA